MNTYTNGFTCAISDNGEEILINFLQNIPSINNDGKIITTSQEIVQTLYMTPSVARSLISVLSDLFNQHMNKELPSETQDAKNK